MVDIECIDRYQKLNDEFEQRSTSEKKFLAESLAFFGDMKR